MIYVYLLTFQPLMDNLLIAHIKCRQVAVFPHRTALKHQINKRIYLCIYREGSA